MSLSYIVKEGFAGLKRTRLASVTSIVALIISVLMLSILFRLAWNGYEVAQAMRAQIEIDVFLVDMSDQRVDQLRGEFSDLSGVDEIEYISKDDAAEIFREEFGAEGESLADLRFLPASFRIQIEEGTGSEEVAALVSQIEGYRGVDDVVYNQYLVELLEDRMETMIYAGAAVGLLILLTAVVLVFNTIRLTIYAKRDLIKAMKLVGATNGFIRRPFVVEGFFQGVIAGGVAAVLHWLTFEHVIPYYLPEVGVMSWPFDYWYYTLGGAALFAVLLGLFGSRWAARKFIRDHTVAPG